MVTQELIALVEAKFREGAKRAQIVEELTKQGYEEVDIDQAIRHIQREAMKQLPIIAPIIRYIEQLDAKTATLSPRKAAFVMGLCGIFIIVLAFGLYIYFDPLGTRNLARDTQRESDIIAVRKALDMYYSDTKMYPVDLALLVPKYITKIPTDPHEQRSYQYAVSDDTTSYQLCVEFETRNPLCISPDVSQNTFPVVVPSETSEQTILPQASDSADISSKSGTPMTTPSAPRNAAPASEKVIGL